MTRDTQPAYTVATGASSAGGRTSWWRRALGRLGHGRARRAAAATLYTALVEQARQPVFYARWGVPDSRDGRLELVTLHAILLMRRLREEGTPGRELAQAVFDRMFQDLDRHLREWGVGDPSVGKRMKELAQSFLGRAAALDPLLAGGDHDGLADGAAAQRLHRGGCTGSARYRPLGALSLGTGSLARGAGRRIAARRADRVRRARARAPDAMAAISHGWQPVAR